MRTAPDVPISLDLEFGMRATNALIAAGVTHLSELVEMTETEVLTLRGIGVESVKAIKEGLADLDLCLGMLWAEAIGEAA